MLGSCLISFFFIVVMMAVGKMCNLDLRRIWAMDGF